MKLTIEVILANSTGDESNCKAQIENTTATVTSFLFPSVDTVYAIQNIVYVHQPNGEDVVFPTAAKTKSALELCQCQQLDIDIKQAQLLEARTQASLATVQLDEAQAAVKMECEPEARRPTNSSTNTGAVFAVVPARAKQHVTRQVPQDTICFSRMPAVRPVSRKKRVTLKEGPTAR